MSKLIIAARAGLANKMRVLLSAMEICSKQNKELFLEWPDFPKLFDLDFPHTHIDYDVFESIGRVKEGDIKIKTCYADPRSLGYMYIKRLNPVKHLREKINNFARECQIEDTIGIHIRCQSNVVRSASFPDNKTLSLENCVKDYIPVIERDPLQRFFLCTDDLTVENYLREAYPRQMLVHEKRDKRLNRWDDAILTYEEKAPLIVMEDAIIDLYLLSYTEYMVCPEHSSFADMARIISEYRRHTVIKLNTLLDIKKYPEFKTSQIENLNKIYKDILGYKKDGVFIDVGAHDGETGSNIDVLADLGWRGYCIEPEISGYLKCEDRHKNNNVKCFNTAIGNYEGNIELYNAGSLSTCDKEAHQKFLNIRWAVNAHRAATKTTVEITTLDNFLITEKILPGFDVLSIDVEGFEYKVLEGFTISKWKPKIIIIELHENHQDLGDFFRDNYDKCNLYFEINGYTKYWNDNINTIYIRKGLV